MAGSEVQSGILFFQNVEIIQAETALFQNQQNVIQAKYDLLKAKIDLDKALGNR